VRQAFRDVRDALTGVTMTKKRVQTGQHQVDAYQETLDLAQKRYTVRSVGLRDVWEAQRQLFSAQLTLSTAIRDRFVATANLFKALGGGWTDDTDSIPDDIDTDLAAADESSD